METQSALSVIAEVAIALAGFSTIAAAISTRSESERAAETWFRFRILLQTSMGITLLAYTPMVVGQIVDDPNRLWIISSAIYATYVVVAMIWALRDMKYGPDELRNERPTLIIQILATTDVTLHTLNIIHFQTSWPYLAGLGCGTAIAMFQFFVLLKGFWWRTE